MSKQSCDSMSPDKDERKFVTWAEFEDWTRTWLIEKFINSSQEPHVITANVPICFFWRDLMKAGFCPKASTDEMQKLFYTFMLDLYRIALKADDWYEHVPYIKNNHINTLAYARRRLRELNGADADNGAGNS